MSEDSAGARLVRALQLSHGVHERLQHICERGLEERGQEVTVDDILRSFSRALRLRNEIAEIATVLRLAITRATEDLNGITPEMAEAELRNLMDRVLLDLCKVLDDIPEELGPYIPPPQPLEPNPEIDDFMEELADLTEIAEDATEAGASAPAPSVPPPLPSRPSKPTRNTLPIGVAPSSDDREDKRTTLVSTVPPPPKLPQDF